MLNGLKERILPTIIGYMVHKRESLTQKEQRAQEAYLATLRVLPRKTKQPVVIAMVGLVGSGKSSVAKKLAEFLPATVIEGDAVRVYLRKEGERYEGMRKIAENAMAEVIQKGANVILDSDHVDAKKRASLRAKAKKAGAELVFVRTYADYDVMAGRTITADYHNQQEDFFGGASSKWQGSEQSKGAVAKLREMWRRTSQHYRSSKKGGGTWILKKLPVALFAQVDTTNSHGWQKEVERVAKRILAL